MSNISIVTAFFDIGRGNWTSDRGLPHYLQRSNETYLERFSHLTNLDNEIVVFTSEDLVEKVKSYSKKEIKIVTLDFKEIAKALIANISLVQNNPEFQSKINPMQVRNPEYWSPEYVAVNFLKSHFVNYAISQNLVGNELVAWLDFGYCRSESSLFGHKSWNYNFDLEKIHLFSIKDFTQGTYIRDIIYNNDVHITGPCIVASKMKWSILTILINHSLNELLINNLIDDDQTLLLMSSLMNPEFFEIHKVSQSDWFTVFRDYNDNIS